MRPGIAQRSISRHGVLLTRPEPGLSESMQAVAALGFEPVACPLLRIVGRELHLPAAFALQAILVTSGQAIGPLSEADAAMKAVPVLAVGDVTAARARAAGFTRTTSAAGDAAGLVTLVRATLPAGSVLLLATGAGQGLSLAQGLRQAGYRVYRRAVYAAKPERRLPEAGQAALADGRIGACLFFSGETARNFVRLCPLPQQRLLAIVRALAISQAVADALSGLPWASVEIATRPDAGAMLMLLQQPRAPEEARASEEARAPEEQEAPASLDEAGHSDPD